MATAPNRLPRPRKRFGQHFLRDTATIRRIVESIRAEDRMPVVEIGPGRGALTAPLAKQCSQLHLIEIDRDLIELLAERYGGNAAVTVHRGDAPVSYTHLTLPTNREV